MKKFQFAALALAALAFIACEKKPEPTPVTPGGDDPEPEVFESLIDVKDGTVADWDNVPAKSVFTATSAANPVKSALKSVKVFADQMYINVYVTWDPDQIVDLEWVPFHCYLDADNSDATGGYGDEFTDPNAEWLFESGIIANGAAGAYDPAVFKWWGEVGANGWIWTEANSRGEDPQETDGDGWGAIIGEGKGGIGACQLIGNNGAEIQLLREAATCITWNATTFGIGFDIQQNWSSVGLLPNADADEVGSEVLAAKMKVTIDMESKK